MAGTAGAIFDAWFRMICRPRGPYDAPHSRTGRAGSLAFEVDDLDAMYRELQQAGGEPGDFGIDAWGSQSHRTFFLREEENGYCYCFFHPLHVQA